MCDNGKCKNPKRPCKKCKKISYMAKRKHHKHHVGRKRRSHKMGAFNKSAFMDTVTIAGSALVTSEILDKVTPSIVTAFAPATPSAAGSTDYTPWIINGGKIAIGMVLGSYASGPYAKVMEGSAIGMILNGGSKIATYFMDTTKPLVAGVTSQPVAFRGNTIGRYHRMGTTLNKPVAFHGNTIGSAQQVIAGKSKKPRTIAL